MGVNDATGDGRGHVISRERQLKWDRSASLVGILDLILKTVRNGSDGKESACNAETQVQSLGQEDPLKKDMATHPGNFAWRIPWTEEPSGLQSTGLQKSQSRLSN